MTEPAPAPGGGLERFRPLVLSADGAPAEPPAQVDFGGAVLFADIAGFTPLTERLAERGREGSELLSDLLTGFFGQLIDIVLDHGGDVWALAGDALLAIWDGGPDDDLAGAARAAATAALVAHDRLGDVHTPDGDRIAMRSALATGAMSLRVLGRAGLPVPFLVGEPFDELARLDKAGVEGALTTGARTARLLSAERTTAQPGDETDAAERVWRVDAPARVPSVRPLLSVRPDALVPEVVGARIGAGLGDLVAEFRRLHVLFVNVEGLAARDPATQTGLVAALQGIADDLGGIAVRFLVDDKGATLIVGFGLPGATHDNDGLRSVRAAQAASEALVGHGFTGGVGVAAGIAHVGPVGNARRAEYTISGMVMNRAARLMQRSVARDGAAPISMDEQTVAALNGAIATSHVELVALKGIAEPVAVHEPVGGLKDRSQVALDRLVGRERERAVLAAAATAAAAGAAALVVVRGEAGMGKSAVVRMFLADLVEVADVAGSDHPGGPRVLRGGASSIERTAPYRLWRPIVAACLGLGARSIDRDEVIAATGRALGPDPRVAAAVLVAIGSGDIDGHLDELSPEGRARLVQDAVLGLLGAAAGGSPLVVVLEDVQWADTASWLLYRRAVREFDATLFVVTERRADDGVAGAGEHPVAGHRADIELTELDEHAVAALGAAALGVDRLPAVLTSFVLERSTGHPLFAEQLLMTLVERRCVLVSDGTCRLAVSVQTLDTLELPDTLQGLLNRRIDELDPEAALTLRVASAIGRSFDATSLSAVHPDPGDLAASLDALVERNLIEIVADDRVPTMRFQHALIRDAAYGLMSFRQRRVLNESIASWYERPDGGGIVPARLAHHLLEADRPERALPYLAAAGEQALSSAAYQEAVGWFRHATTLGGTDTERATWFAQLGRSERFLGRLHESERALRRSLDLSGVPFPTARRLPGALGRSAWRQASNRMGRRAPQHHAAELVVRVHEDLTSVYYLDNQAVPTIMSVLEQLNAAETLGDAEGMVRGYSTMASTCELLLLSRAAHHYERLAAELLDGCAPRVEAVYHQFIAIHYLGSGGRWDEALSSFGRGQELWDELGEPFLALECQSLRATTEFLCGRGSGHEGPSSAVRERAIASDQDVLEAMACIELAVLANRRGDARAALAHLERPLALGADVGQIQRVWALAMEAAALHLDAAPESLEAAEVCLVEMERLRPLAPYNLDAYSMLADLGTDLLAGSGAPYAGRRARSIARRSTMQLWRFTQSYRIGRPRVLVTLAEQRLAAGRPGAAAMLARRAAASAQRMGMGFDEARAALVSEAAAAGGRRVAGDRGRTSALLAAAGDGVQRARVDALAHRGSHRRSIR